MTMNDDGFGSTLADPDDPGRAPRSGGDPFDPAYLRRRVLEDPLDWRRWFQLGSVVWEHTEEAAEAFTQALRLQPSNGLIHRDLATLLHATGAPPSRAIRHLEIAVARRPADRDAWETLALLAQEDGQIDRALTAWLKVASLGPNAETFWSLGECLYAKDRHREAVVALEEAVRRQPNHLPALLLLSIVGRALGEEDTARHNLETAFRINPRRSRELLARYDELPSELPASADRLNA
jgi:cytochrome c-type biogenesis protein CcmH/NrfG